MKLTDFETRGKTATLLTAKVLSIKDKPKYIIEYTYDFKGFYTKSKWTKSLIATFKEKPKGLTIFQVNLIGCIVFLNKLPTNYANYFKTEVGKQFIENLEIEVV
jgi:hypothetical protein